MASCPDDRRSTFGSCDYFRPNIIGWSLKKQSLVARSNTKVEYIALAHTTYELIWIESLMNELHINYSLLTLLYDNLSTMKMSHNPVLHVYTKHIELYIHFVCERVVAQRLQIKHVPSHTQIVDVHTKPLPTNLFIEFRDKLKVASFKPP